MSVPRDFDIFCPLTVRKPCAKTAVGARMPALGPPLTDAELETVLAALKKVAGEVETVFSVGLSSRVYPDGSLVFKDQLARLGYTPYLCGKTNVGLAKPAFAEELR